MNASRSSSDFAPLLKAFRQIESRLQREGEAHVIVAAEELKKFIKQPLAAHNIVAKRELIGHRTTVRGRRRTSQSRIVAAHWPEDKLNELTVPTLYFILRGQADMRLANYNVRCLPGDIIFTPAGIPTSDGSLPDYVDITPQSTCDALMFSPGVTAGTGLECDINHSRGDRHIPGGIDERCWLKNFRIVQLYEGLCEELHARGNTKSTFHFLMLLLIRLQREISDGNAMVGWPFSTVSPPAVKQELIGAAMAYINDHIDEPLTIDVVARQMGVSRVILTRKFRSVNDTFKSYVTRQRIKLAEVLLREANLPVHIVSKRVGLSPGRLRGLFREWHQCTPDEFRNAKKG